MKANLGTWGRLSKPARRAAIAAALLLLAAAIAVSSWWANRPSPGPPPVPGIQSERPSLRSAEAEWKGLQNTANVSKLRAFARRHPDSKYAPQAVEEADRIEKGAQLLAVLDAIERYRSAYQERDLAALRLVFPKLSGVELHSVQDLFRHSRAIEMMLDVRGQPSIQGNQATVVAKRTQRVYRREGNLPPANQDVTFRLRRSGTAWVIESIE